MMGRISTLLDRSRARAPVLPAKLRKLYGGDLGFPRWAEPRPYVLANFVTTLDGVVSYEIKGFASGATISGANEPDRFIMGLLRASVDAIILGPHTLHTTNPRHLWTPGAIFRDAEGQYAAYRKNVLRRPGPPLLVLVTGSGRLELERAVFHTPEVRTLIITTAAGQARLEKLGASRLPSVEILRAPGQGIIRPQRILKLLYVRFGVRRLLNEGGPTLFGKFLAASLIDELFLTVAPQIAGRLRDAARPGLVEEIAFQPASAPWFDLLSVKQHSEYLYLRYRVRRQRARFASAGSIAPRSDIGE